MIIEIEISTYSEATDEWPLPPKWTTVPWVRSHMIRSLQPYDKELATMNVGYWQVRKRERRVRLHPTIHCVMRCKKYVVINDSHSLQLHILFQSLPTVITNDAHFSRHLNELTSENLKHLEKVFADNLAKDKQEFTLAEFKKIVPSKNVSGKWY